MLVRTYVALLIQLMIWSGFTLAEWLSQKDHLFAKILIFIVFFYLAIITAKRLLKSNQQTIMITIASLFTYGIFHLMLRVFFPVS